MNKDRCRPVAGIVRVSIDTARAGPTARRVALFVLGIGRSGTSALTRVLALCGGALPAELSHANADNPRGFWEPRAAVDLNEAILYRHSSRWFDPSLRLQEEGAFDDEEVALCIDEITAFLTALPTAPFVVIKDLQITVLSGLWFEAARLAGFDVAVVNAVRHPHEVISSLQKHNGASPELSGALWVKYSLLAERGTRGLPRVFVDYNSLLDHWRREVGRISAALAIDLNARDERAIDEFLTTDLRHQQHYGPVIEIFGTDWMSTIYQAQSAAARDEPWDASALDRVFESYRASERCFRMAFEDFHARYNGTVVRSTASAEAPRFARERDVLLVEVERNPEDVSVGVLAGSLLFRVG